MIGRRQFLLGAALVQACRRKQASGYRGIAFVATEDPAAIAVVDLMEFGVSSRINLPGPASALLAHPDPAKQKIYALCPGSRLLAEIDIRSRAVARSWKLPGSPVTALTSAPGSAWCLLDGPSQLWQLDLESGKSGKPVPLPAGPLAFDISPKAPLACVTMKDSALAFADLDARRTQPVAGLEGTLGAVRFRSDGKVVLVAERSARRLTVVDLGGGIVTELPLALSPDRMCMNADGGQMFITGEGQDAVVIAYPYRAEIAQTTLTGRKPGDMAVSSVPPYLFVSNPQAGSVTAFDISTQKVVAVTGVGLEPGPIAITQDQQYALVLNRGSGDMSVIRIAAITPGRGKSAPLFTMIPIGLRPAAILVVPV